MSANGKNCGGTTVKHLNILVRLALPLFLIGALCSCGKEGPPVPRDQRNMFAWGETDADFSGNCLVFVGQLDGAQENAKAFTLELEAVVEGICLECPFRAQEFVELTPNSAKDGLFTFQHCPEIEADAYRWRLIAQNAISALPHVLSPVKLVRRPF